MNQSVIDRAVNIATCSALAGHPVERIVWIPPQTASQSEEGCFAIKQYSGQATASTTPPWEES